MKKSNANEFTDVEMESILELRERLHDYTDSADCINENDIAYCKLAIDYINEDATMWRYVLAKSREENAMDASEAMFRASIKWRKELDMFRIAADLYGTNCFVSNGFDNKLSRMKNESIPPSSLLDSEIKRPHTHIPRTASGRMGQCCFYGGIMEHKSITGGPVMVERLGLVDLHGLSNDSYALECTTTSYIVYLEKAWSLVRQTGTKARGHIVIDIQGCGLSMLNYVSIIKHVTQAGVLHYPEISERVSLVNAGWFITTLWGAIRPWLPTRTQEKMNILGGSGRNDGGSIFELTYGDETGKDKLPDFLGGKLTSYQHSICPALSVDQAYGVVLDEILAWEPILDSNAVAIESDVSRHRYPDCERFLEAALKHYSQPIYSNSKEHVDRIAKIQQYLKAHCM